MNSSAKQRDVRLDILRGVFLVIMAAVHVPTPLSHWLQEPFGFTSAAEGFIFLSATLAGFVYGKTYQQHGWRQMSRRVWGRAGKVYLVHLALLVPAALVAWWMSARAVPLANQFHDFLVHPWAGLALIPLLLEQPPLFDILPLYVTFLALTPLVFVAAARFGWKRVLAVSGLVWLAAQFQFDAGFAHGAVRWLPVQLGSFSWCAWQFLWFCGMAAGETATRRPLIAAGHRRLLGGAALVVVLAGLCARHGFWPQQWFSPGLYLWMDKWTLGPLRLFNFGAWVVLLVAWNPRFSTAQLSPLALLGRHSLAVFAGHLPLAIAATTLLGVTSSVPVAEVVIGLLVIALLFPWAAWQERRQAGRTRAAVGNFARHVPDTVLSMGVGKPVGVGSARSPALVLP